MIEHVSTLTDAYADSVALMLVSRDIGALDGVVDASVSQATPLNLDLLADLGFDVAPAAHSSPNHVVLAIRADTTTALDTALAAVEERLRAAPEPPRDGPQRPPARSVTAAARRRPDLSLALISVPGEHALYECARALDDGLHVFCFSEGPKPAEERVLKHRAIERGLLFMGPDCGTAILDGVGLGFANAVRRGPVGIVGASGTGTQAVTCLLDMADVGISHAIGVGGRDLSAAVGAAMTLRAIELLAADPETEAIVVLSKAPDPAVAARVAAAADAAGKPTVLAFPGLDPAVANFAFTAELDEASRRAAELVGASLPAAETAEVSETLGLIRGLFAGGTLRDEAKSVVSAAAGDVGISLDFPGHAFVDFGDDAYTRGRAHPMIDPTLRDAELERQADDLTVGVLLADVVLGYGAHEDPAAQLAPRIERMTRQRSGTLSVSVSVCGTQDDPQGLQRQMQALREAGAIVTRSNAEGARLAVRAAGLKARSA